MLGLSGQGWIRTRDYWCSGSVPMGSPQLLRPPEKVIYDSYKMYKSTFMRFIWGEAHLKVVELKRLRLMRVEIVSHESGRCDEDHQHQYTDDHSCLMSRVEGRRGKRRSFQRALQDVDDPVGCKDVVVDDVLVVDVSRGRLRQRVEFSFEIIFDHRTEGKYLKDILTAVWGFWRSGTRVMVRLWPSRLLMWVTLMSACNTKALPSSRWCSMSLLLSVFLTQHTSILKKAKYCIRGGCELCGSHLVAIETVVVRYKQCGLDCNVAYAIHKLFSGCRRTWIILDLLQNT